MRTCLICKDQRRPTIDDALLRKVSCQKIADETGYGLHQIWRHSKHLDRQPVVVIDESSASMPLIDRIETLVRKSEAIAAAATGEKSWQAATSALRECRCCLELLGKLTGQLQPGGTQIRVGVAVNVSASHSTSELSEFELEQRIAMEVSEATNHFDPATIAKLQRLVAEGSTSHALPDVPLQLTENT